MRLSHPMVGLAVLTLAARRPVHAEDPVNTPVYTVTYFEVAPPAAAETAALARQYADASRKEAGYAGFAMFAEIGRPNRLAILEGRVRQPSVIAPGREWL